MTPIATALKHLIAAGVTGDALVTAIAEIEASSAPVRSKGAERTARWRERHKASQTVTCDSGAVVIDNILSNSQDNNNLPTTAPKSQTVTRDAKRPVSRGTRLPDDFQPLPAIRELALRLGFSDQRFEDEVDRFRDYWRAVPGARGRKLDWQATLRNRIKDIADRIRPKNGSPPQQNTIAAGVSRVRDAINRATSGDRRGGENPEPVSGLLESPGHVHSRTN